MGIDVLIPFGILLVLVVYLIYTRNKFEQNILKIYEEKFEDWKKNNKIEKTEVSSKKLVGLVFKKDYKLSIEVLDEDIKDALQKAKFDIKNCELEK